MSGKRVTRGSGLPLVHQEINSVSSQESKKLKRKDFDTKKKQKIVEQSDGEEEDQTQSISVQDDKNENEKTKKKVGNKSKPEEDSNVTKKKETKEEREKRLKKEKEEKQKQEEEEQKRKDEEERLFIEEFKERYNLTKGKCHKERIENYQNKHYSIKKKETKKNEMIDFSDSDKTIINGKVGLENLGNTCFMNSALQCLSNLQPLTDYCLQNKEEYELNLSNPLGSGGLVIKAFSNLIRDLWSTKDDSISPSEFLRVISYCNKIYSAGRQQDSQEFLLYLLDSIHEDLNRVEKKPYVEQKEHFKNLNQKDQEKLAADSWGDYLKRNKSIIVDLFQGQMKNTLKCLTCKTTKYQFEPFMYLTVPIPSDVKGEIPIQDCIKQFIEKEELDGDEKWYCPECKEFRKSEKKIDLWKLPPILMICMKRFQYTARSKKKITTKVDFPIHQFDMSEFIPKTLQKEKPLYDLFSVISHSGYLNFGHYVAYCKNQEDKQWYLFNDESTKLISDPEESIPKQNAYVLFYQKSTLQLIKRQTLIESVNWPHKV